MKKNHISSNKNQCLYCLDKPFFSPVGKFYISHHFCYARSINFIDGFYFVDGNCYLFERLHKIK